MHPAYFWPIPLTPRSHASFFAPFRQRRRRRRLARRCVRSHSRRLLHRQQPSISRPSLPKSTHPACPLPSPSSLIPSCFHAMLAMTKRNLTPLSLSSTRSFSSLSFLTLLVQREVNKSGVRGRRKSEIGKLLPPCVPLEKMQHTTLPPSLAALTTLS